MVSFIEKTFGSNVSTVLAPWFDEVNKVRETIKELGKPTNNNNEVKNLEKLKDLYILNYQNSMLLNQYFPIGN